MTSHGTHITLSLLRGQKAWWMWPPSLVQSGCNAACSDSLSVSLSLCLSLSCALFLQNHQNHPHFWSFHPISEDEPNISQVVGDLPKLLLLLSVQNTALQFIVANLSIETLLPPHLHL